MKTEQMCGPVKLPRPPEAEKIDPSNVSLAFLYFFNPLTPISDQDRTSPYITHPISSRQVMRIKRNID